MILRENGYKARDLAAEIDLLLNNSRGVLSDPGEFVMAYVQCRDADAAFAEI